MGRGVACSGAVCRGVTGSHAMVIDNLLWSVAIGWWIRELIAIRTGGRRARSPSS
ncbi:MAG TPA: hypothetical protein DEB17_11070 [Chlorobaculum sp.]|uniref:Uncharacterized protein n=1 Tax=Chlorobaculum tepidum (strain ATCC 49652 / DSM 12025 / NBRC 103806 / TLS) TaxID=194439 RepID=Q8KCL2_CHLTE|nr:hypothetical protein CT1403 [Chlorobaculum tepidum TLS]HBU24510.1 hypothetical protein [Chlorobaculum sp.]